MVTSPTRTLTPCSANLTGGRAAGSPGAVIAALSGLRFAKRRSSGSGKPAMPRGNTSTMAMKNSAISTSQNGSVSRSCAVSEPTRSVPMTGPSKLARPPTAAQITRSAERPNPTICGVTMPCCGA